MNNMMQNPEQCYGDKEMLTDLVASQKYITDSYNTFTNECATPVVKTDFMNILKEEHEIQGEVFCEMQKHGWYATEAADQNKINQAKQKYSGTAQ